MMEENNMILMNKKAAIINLGCKVNKYEADAMADKLKSAGLQLVEPEETADVYIVNTCSVTNMAQRKSRQMLRRAKKRNSKAIIIAAGCYVNAEHDVLKQEDFVDIVVGNNRKKDIVDVLEEYFAKHNGVQDIEKIQTLDGICDGEEKDNTDYYLDISKTREYEEMGSIDASSMNHRRAYIKIQDGCNQFCSYCIIPYTRGRVRSRRPENILSEIKKLAKEGVKEFVLTGIHISSYGVDFEKENAETDEKITNLGDLIMAVDRIPEVRRIRLGSLEPRVITEEFLEKVIKSVKICPHFHLSLQSACNDTLKRMNRKYTIEEFETKCQMLRQYFDKPAITTDVIVGFPGETEEEFAVTVANLEVLNLYEIHVFKYSVRSGTVAEKMPNQVSEEIKAKRSDVLLQLTARQKEIYEEQMSGFIDEVLIEEQLKSGGEENQENCFQKKELKEAMVIDGDFDKNGTSSYLKGKTGNDMYFTGHTKRYVKIKLAGDAGMINQIVKVKLV